MNATPLPAGALEDRLNGLLQAPVRIADDPRDPGEAAVQSLRETRRPEVGVFAGAHVTAQDFAVPLA
jgi:hypothetical protein